MSDALGELRWQQSILERCEKVMTAYLEWVKAANDLQSYGEQFHRDAKHEGIFDDLFMRPDDPSPADRQPCRELTCRAMADAIDLKRRRASQ